jgi:hypothetical protein
MTRLFLFLCLFALCSCGFVAAGTPGHEPRDPSVNPVTGERGKEGE